MMKVDCVRKILSSMKIMILVEEEVPTNFVPAVAVIRRGLVLLFITGLKGM